MDCSNAGRARARTSIDSGIAPALRGGTMARCRRWLAAALIAGQLAGCTPAAVKPEAGAARGPIERGAPEAAEAAQPAQATRAARARGDAPAAAEALAPNAYRRDYAPAMDEELAPSPAAPPASESRREYGAGPRHPGREASRARTKSAFGVGVGLGTVGQAAGGAGVQPMARTRGAYQLAQPTTQLALPPSAEWNTEAYAHRTDNPFVTVADSPLSTFSIDVDTASYSNVRRFLHDGVRPPADAVRVEEMINYFRYAYPAPSGDQPFSLHAEVASAPWSPRHRLVHIGLRGREIEQAAVPARNLVFLIDVSGSMQSDDKLPLLKRGLALLTRTLRPQDRIAMVVYAGSSGLVLPSTSGREQGRILGALEALEAGGSTHGAEGIELAYRVAQQSFIRGGINRVLLATDGDFNVGITSQGELTRLIEKKREGGVSLTVLGFGTGNVKDSTMELLADKGNGNYAYVDSLAEAHKVLVREAGSTLVTVAKDVKLQIEWNPKLVSSYRLIGYENRLLADRDFNDDRKDAGEIGAGHTVTALYEIELTAAGNGSGKPREVDPLRYQTERAPTAAAASAELLTLKVRYKHPDGDRSALSSHTVVDGGRDLEQSSDDFRWAAAVAGFGMLLRDSGPRGDVSLQLVRSLARSALGRDESGDRRELLDLIERAASVGVGG